MGWIADLFPHWALRRAMARAALERLYDAASPSNRRVNPRGAQSGDSVMDHAGLKLAYFGRHLDENNDLVHGMLDVAAHQASAITIEPTTKLSNGTLHEPTNDRLRALWARHRDQLDAGGSMPWCQLASLAARTWLRDGEVFAQHMLGTAVRYPTSLPYLVALHEPDMVPYEYTTAHPVRPRVVHGIETDRLGRPIAYRVYRGHPGNSLRDAMFEQNTIRIPVEQMSHLKNIERLGQHRGASALAPVIPLLQDVADYKESERLAAKVASSMCAVITRNSEWHSTSQATDARSGERPMEMQPGVIFDGFAPGEGVQLVGSDRPNPNLPAFVKSMVRGACSAFGVSYSAATHDYDGTYSSQRQELVEMKPRYDFLRAQFDAMFLRHVWRRFVQAALLANQVEPGPADPATLFDYEAVAPAMPWIDPGKEVGADVALIDAGIDSRFGVQRKRGLNSRRVDDERARDTTAPAPAPAATEPAPDPESEESADA